MKCAGIPVSWLAAMACGCQLSDEVVCPCGISAASMPASTSDTASAGKDLPSVAAALRQFLLPAGSLCGPGNRF